MDLRVVGTVEEVRREMEEREHGNQLRPIGGGTEGTRAEVGNLEMGAPVDADPPPPAWQPWH